MKRLEISKLMDGYTDEEFFPGGGETANPEAVKARVLARVKVPAKKRMPQWKAALLAAALAVGALLSIAAGLPNMVYRWANGVVSFDRYADGWSISTTFNRSLIEVADGRVISLLNGGRVDITDRIDGDTPYIVDCSDSDTGVTYYVIMGGTPESFGCFEWIVTPNPFSDGQGVKNSYSYDIYRQDAGEPSYYRAGRVGMDKVILEEGENVPAWLMASMEELDIPYEFVPEENVTTIYGE